MLISKDENIKNSVVYLGYLILKEFKRKDTNKISIYDISEVFKKNKITGYSQFAYSLMFLFSCGIVDFESPFVYKI